MKKNVVFLEKANGLKWLCCISILICLAQIGKGQEYYVGAFSIPPSPESSSLIRKVNVPVDKYTGAANIQIPLYTIEIPNIQIPIALVYQSSGIKVQDMATWVGLGWNLSAGGKITRIVKHLPDETGYSSQENNHWNQIKNLNGWNRNNFESRLKNMDTEPDIFYFEIPGRSGMFIVDENGNAHTIPYQKIKIDWEYRSVFTITDEQGVKYKFSTKETTESTVKDANVTKTVSFTSSWYLSKIETTTGEHINFIYTTGADYEFNNYNKRYVLKFHKYGNNRVEINEQKEQNTLIKIKSPSYLSRISWQNRYISFESSEGRPDLAGGRKLNKIKLYADNSKFLRSFSLTYSTFPGATTYAHTALRLDKIEEVAYTGEKRLLNKFQYNTNYLEKRNSLLYDHWGYRNFTGGVLSGHPSFTCGVINSNGGVTYGYLTGESREVDTVKNQQGMLKRIYYTENSFTEFEFETNRALVDGYEKLQGGLRLKKIKEYENPNTKPLITSYYYHTPNGKSSGKAFMKKPYYMYPIYYSHESIKILGVTHYYTAYHYLAFDQPIPSPFDLNGASIGYSEVKEILPNGSWNIYKFITSEETPDEMYTCYDIYSSKYGSVCPFAPNSSKYWARGLMKEMTNYSKQGIETRKQVYTYKTDLRAREEITAYIPFYWGEGMNFEGGDLRIPKIGIYKWISQPVVLSSTSISGPETLSETTTYTYDPNYLVPREIKTTDVQNSIYKKIITYPFDYNVENAPETRINAYAIKIMNQKNMINYPIESIKYKNNKIIEGTINEYKYLSSSSGQLFALVLDKTKQLMLTEPVTSLTTYNVGVSQDPKYKTTRYYDNYDKYGKLLQYHDENGDTISYIYTYGYLPTAEIRGANVSENNLENEVIFNDFENFHQTLTWAKSGRGFHYGTCIISLSNLKPGTYKVTYWKSSDGGKTWNKTEIPLTINKNDSFSRLTIGDKSSYIDDILIAPEKAEIKSYSYQLGIGKTSETDYNGNTTYYEYDGFGRLIAIYDKDKNLITRYMHHDATTH